MNPSLGRNFEAMDPLGWLARLADHFPDAGRVPMDEEGREIEVDPA